MKKIQMLQAIQETRLSMKTIIDLAKLDIDKILWFDDTMQFDLPYDEVRTALRWIDGVLATEHFNAIRYYRQRGPDYWHRLVQFGDEDSYPEWRELQALLKKFKKRFFGKDKPLFFRKSQVTKFLKQKNKEAKNG